MNQCKYCNKSFEGDGNCCPDCAELHKDRETTSSLPVNIKDDKKKTQKQKSAIPIVSASVSILIIASMLAVLLVNGVFGNHKQEYKNVSGVPYLSTPNSDYHVELGADGNYYVVDKEGNSILFDPSQNGSDSSSTIQSGQLVVGADGNVYVVDGEGNSLIYNPTSHVAIDPNVTIPTYSPQPGYTIPTYNPLPMTTTTTSSRPSNTTTSSTTVNLYNALAMQRKFGFNKMYDHGAGLANFYLDTIRIYFTYEGKDWLIELWKGEYAMASVGCEIGFYYNDKPSSSTNGPLDASIGESKYFKAVEDKDAMYCSMELWQYVRATASEPIKRIDFGRRKCWWAASFENGVLEQHSDRTTLVMRSTIEFPTTEMMELFIYGLEERGFKEGSTSTYKNYECFSVNGKSVTINWRYYDEDKFQSN